MGVIKRDDSRVGIFNSPSEESLHIPQSSEDERSVTSQDDHPLRFIPTAPRNRHKLPVPTYFFNQKKHLGKKKSRHHENAVSLMTLVEEEELGEVTISDFIPGSLNSFGFSRIFRDDTAFQAWEDFINSSEERQEQILHANDIRPSGRSKDTPPKRQLSGDEAFMNIKTGIRNTLKRSDFPIGTLDRLEENLIEFFTKDPNKTYISESITSFERLLLHAISQYHRLISFSVDSASEKARLVQVHNPNLDGFQVPTVLLGQYLEQRKKA